MKYLTPDTWYVNEKLVTVNNKNFSEWREYLKRELLFRRRYRSDFSGKLITEYTGCHVHEGILPRAVVPKSVWWHYKIFHEFNCFLLLPEEHIPQAPSREWCIQHAYERYGREEVRDWMYGLPWKGEPPFKMP